MIFRVYIKCDKCGKEIYTASRFKAISEKGAVEFARNCGWRMGKNHICPDCQKTKTKIAQELYKEEQEYLASMQKPNKVRADRVDYNKPIAFKEYPHKERQLMMYNYLVRELDRLDIIEFSFRTNQQGFLQLNADTYDTNLAFERLEIVERATGEYDVRVK